MSKSHAAAKPRHVPQYVEYCDVQESLGLSRRTVERMVRDGKFLRPVQLAPNRVGWPADVVTSWLTERGTALITQAVTDPKDLPVDHLAPAALELAARAISKRIGEPIDSQDADIRYMRETSWRANSFRPDARTIGRHELSMHNDL